ncbi:MAG TPA: hypothetical protein VNF07_06770 [Acidimicrobiales bacterium]|nr:hypothetical protein [Acidimicrobiales bacterium]
MALAAAAVALGCWWSSLLVIRAAGTLDAFAQTAVTRQISTQLDRLVPNAAHGPEVQRAISKALGNPAVTQALASSVPGGSSILSAELSRFDTSLAPALKGKPLTVDVGQHALASLARKLHGIAKIALIVAIAESAIALIVSPLRHLVLRHLAFGAGLVGGLALLLSWALPALIGHYTHGGAHHFAADLLSGASPVRAVLLELAIGGVLLFVATHLFELVGGSRKFPANGPSTPLPQGTVV